MMMSGEVRAQCTVYNILLESFVFGSGDLLKEFLGKWTEVPTLPDK